MTSHDLMEGKVLIDSRVLIGQNPKQNVVPQRHWLTDLLRAERQSIGNAW